MEVLLPVLVPLGLFGLLALLALRYGAESRPGFDERPVFDDRPNWPAIPRMQPPPPPPPRPHRGGGARERPPVSQPVGASASRAVTRPSGEWSAAST